MEHLNDSTGAGYDKWYTCIGITTGPVEFSVIIPAKGSTHTWAISHNQPVNLFQVLRIRHTGHNSNRHYYLALSGFEIYGKVYSPIK